MRTRPAAADPLVSELQDAVDACGAAARLDGDLLRSVQSVFAAVRAQDNSSFQAAYRRTISIAARAGPADRACTRALASV